MNYLDSFHCVLFTSSAMFASLILPLNDNWNRDYRNMYRFCWDGYPALFFYCLIAKDSLKNREKYVLYLATVCRRILPQKQKDLNPSNPNREGIWPQL